MSQPMKMKATSPRIMHGTPDTSFAASPFAKSLGTPSSPFKASLNAFPALPEEDEYAGFDDTWTPENCTSNAHAGPSGTVRGHRRNASSSSSRQRTSSTTSRHERMTSVEDLEDFFERGTLNDVDNHNSSGTDRARKLSQASTRHFLQNTDRADQLAGLGPSLAPQRQRSTSLSYFDRSLSGTTTGINIQLPTSQNTLDTTPSTRTATPDMFFRRTQIDASPATTATTDSALISPDLSESMLRPLPMGRSLSGWRTPVAAPIDYSARLRAYSESIAGQRKELNDLKELFQREKAEIRASPPVPPYAVRKAFHNKEETERKLALEKEEKEKKIQFQRAKAEADAAAAEKRRIGNVEFAKLKAAHQAAVEAAIKLEAEIRGKPAADKKAAEEKKKAEEKAAKDKHDEQVKAVMDAAAAASPAMSYEDKQHITAYYMHLQNGGAQIPAYEELLKKFYATGGSPASLMQFMEDMRTSEIASAQLAELQKVKAKQDEDLPQAQAARAAEQAKQQAELAAAAAAAAGSPGQRLFRTSPPSPRHPGISPRASPLLPNISANGFPSPGGRSPFPMAALVERVLLQVCRSEEEDRLHALEAMLLLGQQSDKSRGIAVSKDDSPELKHTENSRLQLCASVYPFPRPNHPNVQGILFEQLKKVILHFRRVASQYGASEVTQIRYVPTLEDATGVITPGARMGKISAFIVQHVQDTPNGPVATPPMDAKKPCREYAKHVLPETLSSLPIVYEILVERPHNSKNS